MPVRNPQFIVGKSGRQARSIPSRDSHFSSMKSTAFKTSSRESGVTIIELLASALLIFLGLGGIFAMNTQSLEILRSTRLLSNGSQILQERIETLRSLPWPEIANSQALSQTVYGIPAPSAAELNNASLVETVIFSVPSTPGQPSLDNNTFIIRRMNGVVRVIQGGDFTAQSLLLVDMTVSWQDRSGTKQRQIKTIICRDGLTRSGIFGSAFGRPATVASSSPTQTVASNSPQWKHGSWQRAFTLGEMMISMAGSTVVVGALLLSSMQLQRSLHASEMYATNQAAQRRLLDSLSRDLRRSVGVATTTTIGGSGGIPAHEFDGHHRKQSLARPHAARLLPK